LRKRRSTLSRAPRQCSRASWGRRRSRARRRSRPCRRCRPCRHRVAAASTPGLQGGRPHPGPRPRASTLSLTCRPSTRPGLWCPARRCRVSQCRGSSVPRRKDSRRPLACPASRDRHRGRALPPTRLRRRRHLPPLRCVLPPRRWPRRPASRAGPRTWRSARPRPFPGRQRPAPLRARFRRARPRSARCQPAQVRPARIRVARVRVARV